MQLKLTESNSTKSKEERRAICAATAIKWPAIEMQKVVMEVHIDFYLSFSGQHEVSKSYCFNII